jgi:hypothetical protein
VKEDKPPSDRLQTKRERPFLIDTLMKRRSSVVLAFANRVARSDATPMPDVADMIVLLE